jgi:hypothetical protein
LASLAQVAQLIQKIPDEQLALRLYLKVLEKTGHPPYCEFQKQAFADLIETREGAWLRSRGGSKTCDAADVTVFGGIRGYEPVWRAGSDDQVATARKYFRRNPFVVPGKGGVTHDAVRTLNGGEISLGPLTEKRAHSRRTGMLVYDEERDMAEEDFNGSKGMCSAHPNPIKLHGSTSLAGSVFEKTVDRLRPAGQVHEQTYDQIPFLNQHEIEAQKNEMPEWFWEQEYMCKFTRPGGVVFSKLSQCNAFPDFLHGAIPCRGVDWGGAFDAVVDVTLGTHGEICVVREAREAGSDTEMLWLKQWPYTKAVEGPLSSSFNSGYAIIANKFGALVAGITPSEQSARLMAVVNRPILVAPECKDVWNDLRNAEWGGNGFVLKDSGQHKKAGSKILHENHFLDAFLIACWGLAIGGNTVATNANIYRRNR